MISKKLDLIHSKYSYYILKSKSSSIIKGLNLKTIHRFLPKRKEDLLYNKKGKLINKFFLRPDDKQINNILNKKLN